MVAKACLVACAAVLVVSLSPADYTESIKEESLHVSIARTRQMISVGKEHRSHELFVVVRNVSNAPVSIWDQWNSWGYHNLTFTVTYENGRVVRLKRFGGSIWTQNASDPIKLASGEQYVYLVWLKPEENQLLGNSWGPIDVANGDYPTVKIQAHFEIPDEADARHDDVWVGKIDSKPMSIQLKN